MTVRVLHVIASLEWGAAERQLALLVQSAARDQFDVHVCALSSCGGSASEVHSSGVPVYGVQSRPRFDAPAFARLCRLVRRLAPDLLHTWQPLGFTAGQLAAFVTGTRATVACGRPCRGGPNVWRRTLDHWLAQRVDRFVINLQLPEDREGVGAERTEVIPYGIRVPTEREGRRERGDWLDELAVPRTARLIGVVSPLVAAARIEDAIWAADLLKIVRDDTFLLIVGHGPWRFRLERFCRQVGITDRVRFLNARPDPPSPVGLLDCLWVTGRSAGIHWGLAEAMAWGIPVVAVDCPAHRALVMPGITGMLVACGDRTALARATLHLLEDAAQARQLGEAARRRAREAHRVLPIVARYESLYRSLVG